MKFLILFVSILFFQLGCGVKGKPLPPETPREIGIGKPQFKGVDDELKKNKSEKETQE